MVRSALGRASLGAPVAKVPCTTSEVVCDARLQCRLGRLGGRDGCSPRFEPCSPARGRVEMQASSLAMSQTAGADFFCEDTTANVRERLQLGQVTQVHSPEELEDVIRAKRECIIVLKCKGKYCRPCMAFAKKYTQIAAVFPDVVFLEVIGDESPELRKLMIEFKVKATPTFRIYKNGDLVDTIVGINKTKLTNAIKRAQGTEEL